MNAAIRAVTRTALYNGFEVKGIYHGYRGLLNGEIETFRTENVSNIIQLGGTILKTARSKEFQTPEGRRQAFENMQREHIDALYCSDLSRARATAEAITRYHDIPAVVTPRLTEICMGVWEGRAWGDIEHDFPEQMRYFNTDPDRWSVPGCEPIRDVQKRMKRAIEDLAARHDGQTIVLVSHGMAIRAYLCTVLGIPNSEMATLPYGDNTSVSLLLVDGERTTVEYYNDNRHLPPALSTFGRQTWWRGSGSGVEDLRYEPLRFPRDEAFYLQCYRDAWRNVHETDEGFVPELYARSAARHAQEHPGSVVRVLSGDRVVGLVELDPGRDEQSGCGWISLLYMLPEYRGRGWAIQLLGYAFWFYENHDRAAVRLHVSENNARAITFYQRSGFVQIGRDPGVRAHLLLMGRLIHRTVTHGTV